MLAADSTPSPAARRPIAEVALGLVVRGVLALPLAFGVGALGVGLAYTPAEVGRGAFYAALGLAAPACPGCVMCGMSRAFSALLHGDLPAAFAFNPLVVIAFPAVLTLAAAALYGIVMLSRTPLRLQPPRARGASPIPSFASPDQPGLSVRVSQGEP